MGVVGFGLDPLPNFCVELVAISQYTTLPNMYVELGMISILNPLPENWVNTFGSTRVWITQVWPPYSDIV